MPKPRGAQCEDTGEVALSYAAYLATRHWANVRQQYAKSGRPMVCAVCGSAKVQLHHRTYKRIGRESLDDLVPLCGPHHLEVHAIAKKRRESRPTREEKAERREAHRLENVSRYGPLLPGYRYRWSRWPLKCGKCGERLPARSVAAWTDTGRVKDRFFVCLGCASAGLDPDIIEGNAALDAGWREAMARDA